jgi:hypothetical protein
VLDTSRTNAANLLYALSGTVDSVNLTYWMDSFKDVQDAKWQSIVTKPDIYRTIIINEGAFFAKDDWKAVAQFHTQSRSSMGILRITIYSGRIHDDPARPWPWRVWSGTQHDRRHL